MKRLFLFLLLFLLSVSFSQETLPVYKMVKGKIDEENPVGALSRSDWIKELPIPQVKVKKISWTKEKVVLKDKKQGQKRQPQDQGEKEEGGHLCDGGPQGTAQVCAH